MTTAPIDLLCTPPSLSGAQGNVMMPHDVPVTPRKSLHHQFIYDTNSNNRQYLPPRTLVTGNMITTKSSLTATAATSAYRIDDTIPSLMKKVSYCNYVISMTYFD